MNETPLRDREQRVLAFVKDYIRANGYAPDFQDIRRHTGISSTSVVAYQLDSLQERGLLRRDKGIERSIVLTGPVSRPCPTCGRIP